MLIARRYLIFFAVSSLTIGLFLPVVAHGAGLSTTIIPEVCRGADAATKCNVCQLGELARNILNFLIFFFIIFSAVMFMWAGLKYLTAGGNAQAANIARKTLLQVAGGLLVVLCAWLVVNLTMSILLDKSYSAALPWNQLCKS